ENLNRQFALIRKCIPEFTVIKRKRAITMWLFNFIMRLIAIPISVAVAVSESVIFAILLIIWGFFHLNYIHSDGKPGTVASRSRNETSPRPCGYRRRSRLAEPKASRLPCRNRHSREISSDV